MRVLTFSKEYPKSHPKAGESTWFVQKILWGLCLIQNPENYPSQFVPYKKEIQDYAKYHTVRAGERWKVGDRFSARTWSGKPYRSKQNEFAQLEVKKVWNIEFDECGVPAIDGFYLPSQEDHERLAMNDGLTDDDFTQWIWPGWGKTFRGQIICWNENVAY